MYPSVTQAETARRLALDEMERRSLRARARVSLRRPSLASRLMRVRGAITTGAPFAA
jgi:hypothetical protein